MAMAGREGRRERVKSLAAVAAIHAALGYAFLTGLSPKLVETVEASLKLFEISESPPPPPIVEIVPPPPKESKSAPEGEASPPNIKSVASPVVAPPPEIKIEVPPPPIAAAPLPAQGSDRTTGAAPVVGPGTGAGGIGNGTGAGGRGNGTGAGGAGDGTGAGSGGVAIGARHIKGRLRNSDYPRSAARAKAGGTVMVSYEVGIDGRPHDCRIMKSSGNPDLDGITCYLIEKRFRYAPARDLEGRPVSDRVGWRQDWWLEG